MRYLVWLVAGARSDGRLLECIFFDGVDVHVGVGAPARAAGEVSRVEHEAAADILAERGHARGHQQHVGLRLELPVPGVSHIVLRKQVANMSKGWCVWGCVGGVEQ